MCKNMIEQFRKSSTFCGCHQFHHFDSTLRNFGYISVIVSVLGSVVGLTYSFRYLTTTTSPIFPTTFNPIYQTVFLFLTDRVPSMKEQ